MRTCAISLPCGIENFVERSTTTGLHSKPRFEVRCSKQNTWLAPQLCPAQLIADATASHTVLKVTVTVHIDPLARSYPGTALLVAGVSARALGEGWSGNFGVVGRQEHKARCYQSTTNL
jgi:hypothetical protein